MKRQMKVGDYIRGIPPMATPSACGQRFYSIRELAELLNVSLQSIRRWILSGALASYKCGGVFRIAQQDVDEFLSRSRFGRGK